MAKEIPNFILEYQKEQELREKFDASNSSQATSVTKNQAERNEQLSYSESRKTKPKVKKAPTKTKEPQKVLLKRMNRNKAKDLFRRQIGSLDGRTWSELETINTLDELFAFFAQHGVTYRRKDFLPQKKTKYKEKRVAKSVRAISTPMS